MADPFKSSDAKKIADRCKASFPESWDQIGCVSKEINKFFENFEFNGLRSPCRSHAQAFHVAFDALNIRKTWSQHVNASSAGYEHVANIVFITNDNGAVFSYVIDSGWFPGLLFPKNDLAMRFHARVNGDRTDYFELPAISSNPMYQYKAAK